MYLHFQASDQSSLHFTSKNLLVDTSFKQAHQEHKAHTSPHKVSEALRWKVWALYACFHLCLVFAVLYPQAIVASFLY